MKNKFFRCWISCSLSSDFNLHENLAYINIRQINHIMFLGEIFSDYKKRYSKNFSIIEASCMMCHFFVYQSINR